MTIRTAIGRISQQEGVNFLLTNRIPRRLATRFMGWFSRIEHPLVYRASLRTWQLFTALDLSDAREAEFRSLHACFTRTLREGARPFEQDPLLLASPCDAILGACGTVTGGQVLQVKGLPYALADLLGEDAHARTFEGGQYATLRLTSSMYHRFHTPSDLRVQQVTHVPGDTWNVNPVALKRVARLFCRNERALIRTTLAGGHALTLVPVAAILVAGIRLRFLDLQARDGRRTTRRFACDVALQRGEEMGWFEHGSTILVFAPAGFALCEGLVEGMTLRAGQPLMRVPG